MLLPRSAVVRCRVLFVGALGLVGWGLAGCASPSPELTVVDVRAGERDASTDDAHALLILTIEARNPGEDALPLRDVRYAVRADGRLAFEGLRRAERTIPAFSTQRFELPAPVPLALLAGHSASTTTIELDATVAYLPPRALDRTLLDARLITPSVSLREQRPLDR